MTGWLVKDEVLPRFGFNEIDYAGVLQGRSITIKPVVTRWNVELNGRRIGNAVTKVEKNADGSFQIVNELKLQMAVFERTRPMAATDEQQVPPIFVRSDFYIDPLGQLEQLHVELTINIAEPPPQINVRGVVEGEDLVLKTSGLSEGLAATLPDIRIPNQHQSFFADSLVPLDRIPHLRVGQKWTTRSVNPFAALSGPLSLIFRGDSIEITQNEVVGTDSLESGGRPWECYLIEHRRGDNISETWVRVSDGQVLRREVKFSGLNLAFVADLESDTSPN